MINFSLLFTEPTFGTSVTVLYNTFGRRIETVGEKELNLFDNYEEAHETVDLAISQSLWKWIEAKFTVQNLTNKQRVLTRGGSVYEVDSPGLTYALSISLSR